MSSSFQSQIYLFGLTFRDKAREQAFGEWSLDKSRQNFSEAMLLSALSFASLAWVDYVLLGHLPLEIALLRFLVFPLTNLALWYAGRSSLVKKRRDQDLLAGIFVVVSQVWNFWIPLRYPELGDYYLLLMLMISMVGNITFTGMLFKNFLPLAWSTSVSFFVCLFLFSDFPMPVMALQGYVAFMFTFIALTTGYYIERAIRMEYLHLRDLELQKQALLSKNKELEQFAYIASHDLQEPLRSITSFSQLLNEDHRAAVGETGGRFIDFILEASERMRKLIKGLLDYSRLGREAKLVAVDAGRVLHEVTQDLNAVIEESGARVEAGRLPVINAFETEFRQLLQNLLSNAIKFRVPGRVPEVKVTAEQKGDHWEFAVRDNGIGIEEGHREKIFLIFQRLHSRNQYEGTGIGLANCRKIVELHGGSIWLDSEPGQGSTFYFTIPIQ